MIHATTRQIEETVNYPEHEKRKASKVYKATHHHLIYELDAPCHICGVRHSTLDDPSQNPYGAKQMETHHYYIEWALTNAIDLDKFNKRMLPYLMKRFPDKYTKPFTKIDLVKFVDSEQNMLILCDQHHRGKNRGIHEITHPIWSVQDILLDEYIQKNPIDN